MDAIVRERTLNSRIALRATARGGDGFAVVLDFKVLSRAALPCKQMRKSALFVCVTVVNCDEPCNDAGASPVAIPGARASIEYIQPKYPSTTGAQS
jgi:hypothetical protein